MVMVIVRLPLGENHWPLKDWRRISMRYALTFFSGSVNES
jgi:hypothetical protein